MPSVPEQKAGVPVLRGRLVTLRPVAPGDVPVLLEILDQPAVAAWWRRSEWERVDELGAATFAVVEAGRDEGDRPERGRVVGCIQYTEQTDPDYRSAAVDIFLATEAQGRGVGSDAMRTLLRHLVSRGHHRFTVDPAADNARAIGVYERLGFRRVGTLRQYERLEDGTWRDALLMELLAGDLTE